MKTNWLRRPAFFLAVTLLAEPRFAPAPDVNRALASISADSLRGNLSFLASNLLEGRDTPSRGLDLAAEYIAAQFRRAGLEPAGDDGYFQTAHMARPAIVDEYASLRISSGTRTVTVRPDQATVVSHLPLSLASIPVCRISQVSDEAAAAVQGRVVDLDSNEDSAAAIAALHPAAFLQTEDDESRPLVRRLIDPDQERAAYGGIPRIVVRDRDAIDLLRDAKAREAGITLSIEMRAAAVTPVTVRNVGGLLRGSDPVLRDQYLILSAHYDHLGLQLNGNAFPGANDDGSGTVSVIEIGGALAGMPVHPKRSILFMTFFGEEEGSLGSRYYTSHPLVPLSKTITALNLEQLGRTDATAGREISNATLTGFRYTDIPGTLLEAGSLTGVKVYETPDDGELFKRSDNLPFAERGIPAHTIVVAVDFPDYHLPGDVWQKIDYPNMAKVDRMIALGLVMLAESPAVPHWSKDHPDVARYIQAR